MAVAGVVAGWPPRRVRRARARRLSGSWTAPARRASTCAMPTASIPSSSKAPTGRRHPSSRRTARWIGFFAGGALKKVPAAGGPIVTLCEARAPLGAAWSTRRFIVFASSLTGGLSRVHEDGGTPAMLTTPDAAAGEVRHAWPDLMPDDAGVVFTGLPLAGGPEAARVAVLPFETGPRPDAGRSRDRRLTSRRRVTCCSRATARSSPRRSIPQTLEILGQAVPVLDDVATADAADTNAVSQFAVAPGGHAAAIRLSHPEAAATYRWVRPGRPGAVAPTTARHAGADAASARSRATAAPRAPIGGRRRRDHGAAAVPGARDPVAGRCRRMARGWRSRGVMVTAPRSGRATRAAAALQRLTSDGQNITPIWTADSRRVIYAARQDGPFSLFAKTVGEAAAPSSAGAANRRDSRSPPTSPRRHRHVDAAFPASAAADGLVYVDVRRATARSRRERDSTCGSCRGPAARRSRSCARRRTRRPA